MTRQTNKGNESVKKKGVNNYKSRKEAQRDFVPAEKKICAKLTRGKVDLKDRGGLLLLLFACMPQKMPLIPTDLSP